MTQSHDGILRADLDVSRSAEESVPRIHSNAGSVTGSALQARARPYITAQLLLLVTWAAIEIAVNNPMYAHIEALGATCVPYSWDDGVGILATRGILVFNLLFFTVLAATRLGLTHWTGRR